MNCTEANNLPITYILESIYGCKPEGSRGNEVLFKAPHRNERTASLFVNPQRNLWKDFGTGKGGRAVDLVCELSGVTVTGALLILAGVQAGNPVLSCFSQRVPLASQPTEPTITIKHIQPLQNRALIQYLESRAIPHQIAANVPQLKEAYYTTRQNQYFALAFQNDSQGYELRSKYFKGCTSKDITTIPGPGNGLNLFEGFFDYLSALAFFSQKSCNTTIVLNSLVNLPKVDLSKYEKINLFLDNDEPGQRAAAEITNQHPGAVNRGQQFYPQHKDINCYIMFNI